MSAKTSVEIVVSMVAGPDGFAEAKCQEASSCEPERPTEPEPEAEKPKRKVWII